MTAIISDCGAYRYWLERGTPGAPFVAWVLANPSTADAEQDDPTVRKARGFTQRWGYARFVFVNVFAYRSTDPKGLIGVTDPAGPHNTRYISEALRDADKVVVAWGNAVARPLRPRLRGSLDAIRAFHGGYAPQPLFCLGYTKDRQPRHPLMLAYNTPLEIYKP